MRDAGTNGDQSGLEPEQATRPGELREAWGVPGNVTLADGVDLTLDDPAREATRRRCIALASTGKRCSVNAMTEVLLCPAHGGRLDSSAGGRAKAASLRLVREEAQERMVEARMGARAVIAARVIERARDIRAAVDVAIDRAVAGERGAIRDLVQVLQLAFPAAPDQATSEGRGAAGELTTLSSDELRALAFGGPAPVQRKPSSQAG